MPTDDLSRQVPPETLLEDMISRPDPANTSVLQQKVLSWTPKVLSPEFQLPQGLLYVTLPKDRIGGTEALQVRYEAGKQMLTITHTPTEIIVQVEQPGFEPLPLLSDDDTQALARRIFKGAQDLKIVSTNATATTAEGVGKDSQASHLNGMTWQQDSGRVIFTLKKPAPTKP